MPGERRLTAERGRSRWIAYVPPAAATLAAGAVMMLGGDLFHTDGWAVAGPVMTPAGFLISAAFALENRTRSSNADQVRPMGVRRARRLALLLAGVPVSAAGVPPVAAITITAFTLLAGLAMAVAGYAVAAWTPILAPPLILSSGLIILAAFYLGARSQSAETSP